jgi:hypothetical protein
VIDHEIPTLSGKDAKEEPPLKGNKKASTRHITVR